MNYNFIGFITLLILSGGVAIIIYTILNRSLRKLIEEAVKIPSSTIFYVRIFQICLILISLSAVIDRHWNLKQDAAAMEYVWNAASGISSALLGIAIFLSVYLILTTILVSVLLRHDK